MSCWGKVLESVLKSSLLLFIVLIFSTLFLSSAGAEEQIRIGGTGGALAVLNMVASEFQKAHPGSSIRILPSLGSSGGIKAVIAGALDIGVSARPLNEKEQGAAIAHEYGRTPFVFATSKNNPAVGFTLSALVGIYSGATWSWPDGRPVRAVLRPAAEYDTSLLKNMSPEMDQAIAAALAREGMIVAVTDRDNAVTLEKVPGALGTMTLAQIISEKRPLKVLTLNGVRPGLDTLANGSYPYFKTYYLVTKPEPRPAARKFIAFVCSGPGKQLLARSGYQVTAR